MEREMKKPERKPFPTLLSKSDAMLHAASMLEELLSNLELLNVFKEVLTDEHERDADEAAKENFRELRRLISGIMDVDLQRAAIDGAIKEIRAMATESKLAEARAAAHGINAPRQEA